MEGNIVRRCSLDGLTSATFPNRVLMIVDDEDLGQFQGTSTSIPDTSGTLFLGKDSFKGCITNLYTRR